ncbi:MAG: hypothetical protein HYT98_04935 [Candidatus Sungbacteria bacterium]|nr:hypothetical protein [Candidatus Sungbacteria bacterium]
MVKHGKTRARRGKTMRLQDMLVIKLPDGKEIKVQRHGSRYQVVINHGAYGMVSHSTDSVYVEWDNSDPESLAAQEYVGDIDAKRLQRLLPHTAALIMDKFGKRAIGISVPTYSYPDDLKPK